MGAVLFLFLGAWEWESHTASVARRNAFVSIGSVVAVAVVLCRSQSQVGRGMLANATGGVDAM